MDEKDQVKLDMQCSDFEELLRMGVCPYCGESLIDGVCLDCRVDGRAYLQKEE